MKSFQDLVCPGHYKLTMGHHLFLRSPKGWPKALGIIYYLHCAWRPQFSGKVERANQFLKSATKKITHETSLGWKEALPIAVLCTHIAPKEQVGLSHYEMLYGRPFVYVNDLFLDPEAQTFSLIPWLLGNSNRIHACGVWTRTQKILRSHYYLLQGLKSYLKSGKMGPQRLNSSPHGRSPTL